MQTCVPPRVLAVIKRGRWKLVVTQGAPGVSGDALRKSGTPSQVFLEAPRIRSHGRRRVCRLSAFCSKIWAALQSRCCPNRFNQCCTDLDGSRRI